MSLISISNLTFAHDGSYDNIFENVSFRIDTDWKLGFTGRICLIRLRIWISMLFMPMTWGHYMQDT